MTTAAGVSFNEVMQGGFGAGAIEPFDGERRGLDAGSLLTFHVAASIPDVVRFVGAAPHAGTLGGAITFAAIGADRAAAAGHFELFTPTTDPGLSLMVYRASIQTEQGVFFLDGAKHVRRRLLQSWNDTTTLSCRLHAGPDATAPVVAAGVLHISPVGFARQLVSFRPTGGATLSAKVAALTRFFAFFSGRLIATYVLPRPR